MTDTRRTPINPAGVPAPVRSYYSNAIRVEAGPMIYIAGQIPTDADGAIVGKGDIVAQAAQVFHNIETILASGGGSLADLVKVSVFVTDMSQFGRLAELRQQLFPKDGPASVCVEVSALVDPDILIEIDGIAIAR